MNISVMRSDRRKNPEKIAYEFLTFEECKNLGSHSYVLDTNGKIAEVKITSVKTWKTRPNELLIGWKFGLYEYGKQEVTAERSNDFFVRIVPLIEHDEMRAIRRQVINNYLHYGHKSADYIKSEVRGGELLDYGYELKAYNE